MSKIKDIMDVDAADPLDPSTQSGPINIFESGTDSDIKGSSQPAREPSSTRPSPARDIKGKSTSSQRKTGRVTKTSTLPSSSQADTQRRRSSATSMDSISQSSVATARGVDGSGIPVKYTPVTHRVSRAKKGIPVHTCDKCGKTFTRAEHLRRHQLSHQNAAFPCTYLDCERKFHRADLLNRHLNRHETQGEKPYKSSGEGRSPSPSVSSGPQSPSQSSPSNTANREIPRDDAPQVPQQSFCSTPEFEGNPGGRDAGQPSTSRKSSSTSNVTQTRSADGDGTSRYNTHHDPGPIHSLSLYPTPLEGSPFCSSDSTYSTPSSATSKNDRSGSTATNADWGTRVAYSPPVIATQNAGPTFDYPDPGYGSPRMSPAMPTQPLLMPSSFRGYGEDLVGIPASTPLIMPMAQTFSAPQLAEPHVGMVNTRGSKIMVDVYGPNYVKAGARGADRSDYLGVYVDSFWEHFDSIFPIVHRATYVGRSTSILTLSMAALGTQFHNGSEDRKTGSELHSRCKRMIGEFASWDMDVMRAIVLTEVFGIFRSPKVDVRLSRVFKELYSRLSHQFEVDHPFARLSAETLPFFLMNPSLVQDLQGRHSDTEPSVWRSWIEYEARQRLRSACFAFNSHHGILFEQSSFISGSASYFQGKTTPQFPCAKQLWNAENEEQWAQQIRTIDCVVPTPSCIPGSPTLVDVAEQPAFTQILVLTSLFAPTSPRDLNVSYDYINNNAIHVTIANTFPNHVISHTYLQLQYTPLRDILAISGDTWVLGRKAGSIREFNAIKPRLRHWTSTAAAAKAVWHACRVITLAFESLKALDDACSRICEYWSLYTAALVCWAFGHRASPSYLSASAGKKTSKLAASSASSSSISSSSASSLSSRSNSSATLALTPTVDEVVATRAAALAYTEAMSSMRYEDLHQAPMRGETTALVDAVRHRLEIDSVGRRSGMLVDAVLVLGKLGKEAKMF